MKTPLISVVIPSYNAEPYLGFAIESVLNQTFRDFELLVIDDASTDGTSAVLARFQDPRLHVHRNQRNLGIAQTRNLGISLSRGKYLAWLDADDVCKPNRFAEQISFLESHPDHILCCANVRGIDSKGKIISGPWWGNRREPPQEWEMCWTNPVVQSTVMARLESLQRISNIYDDAYVPAEDYHLWTRLVLLGRIHRIDEVLVYYRNLENSAYHVRKEHATKMALTSNISFIRQLSDTMPDFHARLTSFAWNTWKPSDPLEFHVVLEWMEKVLSLIAAKSGWSPSEREIANKDLRKRLFRFFFPPAAVPPSAEAVRWFREQSFAWILLFTAKRIVRRIRKLTA